ncbi:MAG: CopG family transcriptional regulator [Desulfobacterium sp.]|nr:CopG family transcriptional regulator [Desulfobacterium sp.]
MRTVLSVSLPEKMAKDLNTFAREMGRNKSDIVKESLSLYLWEEKLRKAQKIFYTKAKVKGILTEEDMLREIS